jgi:hypothetical protein
MLSLRFVGRDVIRLNIPLVDNYTYLLYRLSMLRKWQKPRPENVNQAVNQFVKRNGQTVHEYVKDYEFD